MSRQTARPFLVLTLSAFLSWSVGCSSPMVSSGGPPPPPPPSGANVQPLTVSTGPAAADGFPFPNGAFTSVTICVPGSTSQCETIGGILVDTGSSGLRILSSAITLSLPQQVDASSNAMAECGQFGSGFTWGPVQEADLTISGEAAKSLPIQVLGSPNFPDTDADVNACSQGRANTAADLNTLDNLGANGILGVGSFAEDCGSACVTAGPANPGNYYSCPTAATCTVTTEALASQVVNPVVLFPVDNNGVVIQLPAVPAASATTSVNGFLIFGIGTESNNGLGNASVFGVDPATGNFTTTFGTTTLTDAAFIDSGSEALFFLDSATTGLPACTVNTSLYCPATNANLTATNQGTNATNGQVNFTVGNGDALTSNSADGAINGVAGPFSGGFDWGLPFFFGRTVFTAIDGQTTPAGAGPFWAY